MSNKDNVDYRFQEFGDRVNEAFTIFKYNGTKEEKEYKKKYDVFCRGLEKFYAMGEVSPIFSQIVIYTLRLQKKRLTLKNARIVYKTKVLLGNEKKPLFWVTERSNSKFNNITCQGSCKENIEIFVKNNQKYIKENYILLYQNITYLKDDTNYKELTYKCPNCGEIGKVEELISSGCSFCRTHFIVSDLYPKVTGYYSTINHMAIKEDSIQEKIRDRKYRRKVIFLFSLIIMIIGFFSTFFGQFSETNMPGIDKIISIISVIVGSIFSGFIFGMCYMFFRLAISSIGLMAHSFSQGLKKIPIDDKTLRAEGAINNFLKTYNQNITVYDFVYKVLNMIKVMVYSENINNVAYYVGKNIEHKYKNVISINYLYPEYHDISVNGDYAEVDITIHCEILEVENDKVKARKTGYRITTAKTIKNETDNNFFIENVKCHHCGGSFDATLVKNCPWCRNEYDLKDYDWVITKFEEI